MVAVVSGSGCPIGNCLRKMLYDRMLTPLPGTFLTGLPHFDLSYHQDIACNHGAC